MTNIYVSILYLDVLGFRVYDHDRLGPHEYENHFRDHVCARARRRLKISC
jgi:hypothetical protein